MLTPFVEVRILAMLNNGTTLAQSEAIAAKMVELFGAESTGVGVAAMAATPFRSLMQQAIGEIELDELSRFRNRPTVQMRGVRAVIDRETTPVYAVIGRVTGVVSVYSTEALAKARAATFNRYPTNDDGSADVDVSYCVEKTTQEKLRQETGSEWSLFDLAGRVNQ